MNNTFTFTFICNPYFHHREPLCVCKSASNKNLHISLDGLNAHQIAMIPFFFFFLDNFTPQKSLTDRLTFHQPLIFWTCYFIFEILTQSQWGIPCVEISKRCQCDHGTDLLCCLIPLREQATVVISVLRQQKMRPRRNERRKLFF